MKHYGNRWHSRPHPLAARSRGTRLKRVWQGKEYEVLVLGNGRFVLDGREYTSLSAVAKVITGKKWNGRLFFGVKSSQ